MNDYTNPDYNRVALLTIDVQRDCTIPGAPIEIPGTIGILPKIQSLVRTFRSSQKPIIHVVRLYLPDGSNADACRRKAIELGKRVLAPESDGAELMEELKPTLVVRLDAANLLKGELQSIGPKEWIMYKPRWRGIFQNSLGEASAQPGY